MTNNWYSKIFRKLHLDWHQPPWIKKPASAFNRKAARNQARMFRRAGIQAVEFFIYDHHGQAYFPSKIGVRHPHWKVDYPGLMVEALHEQGLKAIGYMNVLTSIHLAKRHPKWFVRRPDGTYPRGAWLTYPHSWVCLASPYADKYFLPLVEETLTHYQLDGLWLDALCWMVDVVCHCPYCTERFRHAVGRAPPEQMPVDMEKCSAKERALWFAWKTYRLGLVAEFHQKIVALAHNLRPGIVVMDNTAGQSGQPFVETRNDCFQRWLSSSELLVDAFSCDPVPTGGNHEVILSLHSRHQVTTGKPFDFMNERFHCWGEWQTRSPLDWHLEFATIIANGGRCFFADNPYPDGSLEPTVYRLLKPAYDFVKAREPLCRDAAPVYEIGILAAAPSHAFGLPLLHDAPRFLPVPSLADRVAGAHLISVELGWQAHIFDEMTLRRQLNKLRCVVVPDQELMEQATVDALHDFVRRGGKLFLTGGCGRFDERFRKRSRWPFTELAGLCHEDEWPSPVNYFRPTTAFAAHSRDLEELPVECWGRAMRFRTNGATILVPLSEPIPDVWRNGKHARENFQHHTLTGACPPARKTTGGAIFLNRYGRGHVLTLAMDPFARYAVEGHRLLRGVIDAGFEMLYPRKERTVFSTDKPLHVELHLLRQPGRLVLHAVNFFAQKRRGSMVTNEEVSPCRAFRVGLRPSFPIARVTVEPSGRSLKSRHRGDSIEVEVPSFALHTAVVFHTTSR